MYYMKLTKKDKELIKKFADLWKKPQDQVVSFGQGVFFFTHPANRS